jgi:co-chaperonin GroES (HSP10)
MAEHIFEPHKIKKFHALRDFVVVEEMNFAERITSSGIILHSDNAKSEGIRPRWGKVYAVGPEQNEIRVGQWVCVEHGRWTRGVDIEDPAGKHTIRRVDHNDILLVSDSEPVDDTMSDAITVASKSRD